MSLQRYKNTSNLYLAIIIYLYSAIEYFYIEYLYARIEDDNYNILLSHVYTLLNNDILI